MANQDSEDPRRVLGRHGEQLAAEHLERLGFSVVARNHRTRFGELDLVAFDGEVLAFVEVNGGFRAPGVRPGFGPGRKCAMSPDPAMTITTAMVDDLEMALMAARKDGDVVAFLVPYGPDHTAGLAAHQKLVDRLRKRGLTIRVATRRAHNGLALLLDDVTPRPSGLDAGAPPTLG